MIVECFLYIIYPFGNLVTNKYSWKAVLFTCCAIYVLNAFFLLVKNIDFYWMHKNVFAFLIYWWMGAFAVQVAADSKMQERVNLKTLLFLYGGYLAICHLLKINGTPDMLMVIHYLKSFVLAMVIAYFLALLYIHKDIKPQGKHNVFTNIFLSLGEKSYSLYAIHYPIIGMVSYYLAKYNVKEGILLYSVKVFAVTIFTGIFLRHRTAVTLLWA